MRQRSLPTALSTIICITIAVFAVPLAAADRVQVMVAGGWGFYQMDQLNERYIGDFARPFGLLEDDVSNGMNFQFDVDYFVADRVTVGIGAEYLTGASEEELLLPITDDGGMVIEIVEADVKLQTTAFAPHVRAQYIKPAGSFNLIVGAGAAYLFAKSQFSIDAAQPLGTDGPEYTANGFGFFGNLGLSRSLSKRFSIILMSGYRVYKTDELEDDGEPWVVDYDGPARTIELDFSGPYVMAGLTVKL